MTRICVRCGKPLPEWQRRKGHKYCVDCFYGKTFKAEQVREKRREEFKRKFKRCYVCGSTKNVQIFLIPVSSDICTKEIR